MKFKFGDSIEILNGFYEGSIGTVTDYRDTDKNCWDEYCVRGIKITTNDYLEFNTWIKENEMVKR